MTRSQDPNLLVGIETADDAGVYRLSDDLALVVTADFITPPVDDPYMFGQIAATNALSDVYAMGGKPIVCLNLVGFPADQLGPEVLAAIMEGAMSKITEAGASLAGGHSVEDEEPKFGLSVTGLVHPDKIWRNVGARVGDRLILTKPIGSGVIINACRKDLVPKAALDACLELITTLNKVPAEILARYEVHACTDITGFGLAGHAYEAAEPSGVTFRIRMERLPIMDGTLDMYRKGVSTGVNKANRSLVEDHFHFEVELPKWHQEIVFDPQTAGPLFAAVPAEQAEAVVKELREAGLVHAVEIGEVVERESHSIIFQ